MQEEAELGMRSFRPCHRRGSGRAGGLGGSGKLTGRRKKPAPGSSSCLRSLFPELLLLVEDAMASRLLRGAGALAAQALRARGPSGVAAVRSMASGGTRLAGRARDQTVALPGWSQGGQAGLAVQLLEVPVAAYGPECLRFCRHLSVILDRCSCRPPN